MNPYETEIQLVSKKQRYILVQCYLYYKRDSPIISDREFDAEAKDLAERIKKMRKDDFFKTDYSYVFYDFDGSTGFDLFDRLYSCDKEKIKNLAEFVLIKR